ncbi:MAG TPA: HAD-IC family P-type ATPase, partial [Gammaproteobacteria bacterium]|nr:HAD-IC family P-type ATPase [Gammaproteobacteria bacterium]
MNETQTDEEQLSSLTPDELEGKDVDEVLAELGTDVEKGLSGQEANRRRAYVGPNTLKEEEGPSAIVRFLSYFWGPIPWMIEVAALLAAVSQRWEDLFVILALLAVNGGVGFWHEQKASQAIAALKKRLALEALVLRDGERSKLPARDLVPGDLILVHIGDVVPADAQILKDQSLSADESPLTGESLPVSKGGGDMVYSGTTAKQGRAWAVVVATGTRTKFARTVELVEEAGGQSHFQRAVIRIGYFLIAAALPLVGIIVGVSIYRGDPFWTVILFALGLVLASIPAALPAVLSVTMSIGAGRLARMKTIVSRLAAMDEVAGMEVLCADKTGTLTKNELALQDPVLIEGEDPGQVITAAALTVDRDEPDPIDEAIMRSLGGEDPFQEYEVRDFRPFDPTRKRAESDVVREGQTATVAKGAPQVILDLVGASVELQDRVNREVDRLGA